MYYQLPCFFSLLLIGAFVDNTMGKINLLNVLSVFMSNWCRSLRYGTMITTKNRLNDQKWCTTEEEIKMQLKLPPRAPDPKNVEFKEPLRQWEVQPRCFKLLHITKSFILGCWEQEAASPRASRVEKRAVTWRRGSQYTRWLSSNWFNWRWLENRTGARQRLLEWTSLSWAVYLLLRTRLPSCQKSTI